MIRLKIVLLFVEGSLTATSARYRDPPDASPDPPCMHKKSKTPFSRVSLDDDDDNDNERHRDGRLPRRAKSSRVRRVPSENSANSFPYKGAHGSASACHVARESISVPRVSREDRFEERERAR